MDRSTVTGERLLLRPLTESDRPALYRLWDESSESRGAPRDTARAAGWREISRPDHLNMAIVERSSGAFVGRIELRGTGHPLPELGIELSRAFRGRGYGSEAVRVFCAHLTARRGAEPIRVRIREENHRSRRMFERLGAKYIGRSTYFSEELLDTLRQTLPGALPAALTEPSILEYRLTL